jgi:hypothetical protein
LHSNAGLHRLNPAIETFTDGVLLIKSFHHVNFTYPSVDLFEVPSKAQTRNLDLHVSEFQLQISNNTRLCVGHVLSKGTRSWFPDMNSALYI